MAPRIEFHIADALCDRILDDGEPLFLRAVEREGRDR
jgi:hypothetical protein